MSCALALSLSVFVLPAHAEEVVNWDAFTQAVPGLGDDLDRSPGNTGPSTEPGTGRPLPGNELPPVDQAALRDFVKASRTGGDAVVDTARSGAELVKHRDGSVSTTVVRTGDSVHALVQIPGRSAPSTVTFDIQGQLSQDGEGVITALRSDGNRWIVAPPWAKDAAGREVPTRYEVQNGKLAQIIDHTSQDFTYPIVADPWLGRRLFYTVRRDTYRGDYRYNAWMTPWGSASSKGAAGYIIMRNYGWAEWRSAYSGVTNKPTINQQFNCHALGASIGIDVLMGQWNVERFRRNNNSWVSMLHSHRCNW